MSANKKNNYKMENENEKKILIEILSKNNLKEFTKEIQEFKIKLINLMNSRKCNPDFELSPKIDYNKNHFLNKKRKKKICPIIREENTTDEIVAKVDLLIKEKKINPILEKRRKANYFYLIYEHNDKKLIENKLKGRFKDIEIKFSLNRNLNKYVELLIYFQKQKNLYLHHNSLKINGMIPYLLSTKESSKCVFKLRRKLKKSLENHKYYWMQKTLPTINKGESDEKCVISGKEFNLRTFHRNLYKVLNNNDNSVLNQFCYNFILEIKNMNIKILNEILCHYIILKAIDKINKRKKRINLIACDYNFSEYFEGSKKFFKPDLVLTIKNRLIIIEFKYRLDRCDQKIDALNCIHYKQYPSRLINYFKTNNMKEILHNINEVMILGIAFTNKDRICCGIIYELYSMEIFENLDYQTLEFYETMKQQKRRFKKL